MARDTITDLARNARMDRRQDRLMNRRGLSAGQARRASNLYSRSLRDWRRGGRQGARPTLRAAADFTTGLRNVGEQADRRDLRRAYRTGGYADYTPGADMGAMLDTYRAGLQQEVAAAPETDQPRSMWRRDAEPGTYSPIYDVQGANLNDLVDRDRWLQAIGADYGLSEGAYVPPGRYGGFDPNDLPSRLEYQIMMSEDPRFRPGGRFG